MQIVIDISNSEIPKQQDIIEIPLHFIDGKVCEVGGYEFDVLPKGHGRLIDANDVKSYFSDREGDDFTAFHFYDAVESAPTVIDADKEQEDNGFFDEIMDDSEDGEVYEKIKEIIAKVKEQEE